MLWSTGAGCSSTRRLVYWTPGRELARENDTTSEGSGALLAATPMVLRILYRGLEVSEELQLLYDLAGALLWLLLVRLENQVRGRRGLVGIGDTRELRYLPGVRLRV